MASGRNRLVDALEKAGFVVGRINGSHHIMRDILFAELENRFPDAIFEVRSDWPVGRLEWWEVVRMGLR
jgi:hypothetical protein